MMISKISGISDLPFSVLNLTYLVKMRISAREVLGSSPKYYVVNKVANDLFFAGGIWSLVQAIITKPTQ